AADTRPVRVGFAAETQDLLEHATEKLVRKSLDLMVANDVSADVFGADTNQVTLLWSDGHRQDLPRLPKTEVAERVLDAVTALLSQRHPSSCSPRLERKSFNAACTPWRSDPVPRRAPLRSGIRPAATLRTP